MVWTWKLFLTGLFFFAFVPFYSLAFGYNKWLDKAFDLSIAVMIFSILAGMWIYL